MLISKCQGHGHDYQNSTKTILKYKKLFMSIFFGNSNQTLKNRLDSHLLFELPKAEYIPTVENTLLLYRNLNVKWFNHLESFGGLHFRSIYSLQLLRPSYCKKDWIQIILVAIILESHGIVYRNFSLHTHEVLAQPLSQSHSFQVLAPISQICPPKPS